MKPPAPYCHGSSQQADKRVSLARTRSFYASPCARRMRRIVWIAPCAWLRTNLARIQPLGEHWALQYKRLDSLTAERTRDLGREHINRKVVRKLGIMLETLRAHQRINPSRAAPQSQDILAAYEVTDVVAWPLRPAP